jgi:hypothetical protein
MNMFAHFCPLESISDEPNTIRRDQNFTFFLNMDLEILCLFLFKSSEKLFERPEKLFLMSNQKVYIHSVSAFSNMQEIVGVSHVVE